MCHTGFRRGPLPPVSGDQGAYGAPVDREQAAGTHPARLGLLENNMAADTIRLIPALCHDMVAALKSADWHAAERGDVGTADGWALAAQAYAYAVGYAVAAVDPDAGVVQGEALADALEEMSRLEKHWGDDPQTAKARAAVVRLLSWDTTGRDLCAMLRAGEG